MGVLAVTLCTFASKHPENALLNIIEFYLSIAGIRNRFLE